VRLWRSRRAGAGSGRGRARRLSRALEQLLERLAGAGFERAPSESLESLARRLRDARFEREPAPGSAPSRHTASVEPALLEAADLLERYAAHRYGDVGDWGGLERELGSWPGSLRA